MEGLVTRKTWRPVETLRCQIYSLASWLATPQLMLRVAKNVSNFGFEGFVLGRVMFCSSNIQNKW